MKPQISLAHARRLVVGAALVLVAGAVALPGDGAGAATVTATHITVDSVVTPTITLPGTTGGTGNIYIVKNVPFQVAVTYRDANGNPAPLPSKDKAVSLTVTGGPDDGQTTTHQVASAETGFTFQVTLADAGNSVGVTAAVPGHNTGVTSGSSPSFSVLSQSLQFGSGSTFNQIGGTHDSGGCTPTSTDPVCADLLTPLGANSDIFLSAGVCTGVSKCSSSFVQAILDVSNYSRSNPATLVMKCYKALCGVGAIHKQQLIVNLAPTDTGTAAAPDCPAKGTVGANQQYCVDYVQSTRDNAGDTLLYLLFVDDAKIRFP